MIKIIYGIIAIAGSFMAAPSIHADIYDVLREQNNNNADLTLDAAKNLSPDSVVSANPDAPTIDDSRPLTLREQAFKELLNKTFPMDPKQIVDLHKELDKSQAAIQTPPKAPPQPTSSTLTVDLSPGATPPVIRLATGFVSSVVFVDSTGQPWPIADYSLGNPTGFNIQWDSKTNTFFMQSMKNYLSGNMAVRLANLETPIMISLVTGQKDVDYRIDLQLPTRGPNAAAPIVDNTFSQTLSPTLLSILDGIPPVGSRELGVSNGYGQAWLTNGKLLFRTKLTLLSPAWSASVSSPDGTRVYELSPTPLILAAQDGKPLKIMVTGL